MFDLEEAEGHPEYNQMPALEKITQILENSNIKAVFNTTGKIVEKYPELILRLHSDGHEIANHSYNHEDYKTIVDDLLQISLTKTDNILRHN